MATIDINRRMVVDLVDDLDAVIDGMMCPETGVSCHEATLDVLERGENDEERVCECDTCRRYMRLADLQVMLADAIGTRPKGGWYQISVDDEPDYIPVNG